MAVLIIVFALALGAAVSGHLLEPGDSNVGIFGGSDAKIGQYPHQVALKKNNQFACGGSIISPNWILTAGHCVARLKGNASSIVVVVGTIYLNSGGVEHRVAEIILHEDYRKKLQNDVAVLRLASPISYNNVVRPIGLASSTVPDNVPCFLSGWGATKVPMSEIPNILQQIRLTSITLEDCRKRVPSGAYKAQVSEMCTIAPIGQGACFGDSGSPLLCGGVQAGIHTSGIACAAGYPDVHADVSYHREWIRSKTGV